MNEYMLNLLDNQKLKLAVAVVLFSALAIFCFRVEAAGEPTGEMPRTLIVPDDYTRIQQAIDAADPGDTVYVRRGTYTESIEFKQGISLVGEGMDTVTVRSELNSKSVIMVRDCDGGLISGLTLEGGGKDKTDILAKGIFIRDSSLILSDCRIRNTSSNCIRVEGSTEVIIKNCIIESSPDHGIDIYGKGTYVEIIGSRCERAATGIIFTGGSEGVVENTTCSHNKGHGISVGGNGTKVELIQNQCDFNSYGMEIWNGAQATVFGNICRNNRSKGISVDRKNAKATLTKNQCLNNGQDGIIFKQGAIGTVEENICEQNKGEGIYVRGAGTNVILRNNQCLKNQRRGILFGKGASGTIEKNTCEYNEWGSGTEFQLQIGVQTLY